MFCLFYGPEPYFRVFTGSGGGGGGGGGVGGDGLRDEDGNDDAGFLGGANTRPFDAMSDRTATEGIDWRIVFVVSLVFRIWFGQP
jgi:hypothetical protein